MPRRRPVNADAPAGSSLDKTLCDAAERGDAAETERLLQAGAHANATEKTGWCALHRASLHGGTQVVPILLRYNAEVNARTTFRRTALMFAAMGGHTDIMMLLLKAGADPALEDREKFTARRHAEARKQSAAVEVLNPWESEKAHVCGAHIQLWSSQ